MSFEIDLLNTYGVCGHERSQALYHVETTKDCQGNDVEVLVYDISVEVRIEKAIARLTYERQPRTVLAMNVGQAA